MRRRPPARMLVGAAIVLLVGSSACGTGTGGEPSAAWLASSPRTPVPPPAEGATVSLSSGPAAGGGTSLTIRVTGGSKHVTPQVFVDSDDDRSTGMWTLQSPLSASGWDLLIDGGGRLFRHDGAENVWRWQRIDVAGFRRTATSSGIDLSIPGSLLRGSPFRVRVAVEAGGDWSPAVFLPGVAFPPEAPAAIGRGPHSPAPLAIHYSATPWLVRECQWTDPVACPARAFAQFAHIVLVSGLEEPTHPGHARARQLLQEIRAVAPATEVWGYISLIGGPANRAFRPVVYTLGDIRARAAAWQAMGATGVFLDEADLCRPTRDSCARNSSGEEFEVSRGRQAAAVDAIHAMGMPVFANGFAVPDVLATVDGRPSPLTGARDGRAADMYLLENLTVSAGTLASGFDAQVGHARLELAQRLVAATGVRLAAVDTLHGPAPDLATGPMAYRVGLALATKAGLDAYGFTNSSYSSEASTATNLALPPGARAPDGALRCRAGPC